MNFVLIFCNSTAGRLIYAYSHYNMVKNTFEGNAAQQFFHTEKLVQLLDDHRAGKADNSRKIWTVYMFLVWYHVYFESDVIPTKPNVSCF